MPAQAVGLRVELVDNLDELAQYVDLGGGSCERTWVSSRALRVHLDYVGNYDPRIVLQWAFFARDETGGRIVQIVSEEPLVLASAPRDKRLAAPPLRWKETIIPSIRYRRTTGAQPAGHVVRVMQDGHLLAADESFAGAQDLLIQALANMARAAPVPPGRLTRPTNRPKIFEISPTPRS